MKNNSKYYDRTWYPKAKGHHKFKWCHITSIDFKEVHMLDNIKTGYWAGCNYWKNEDGVTATSMHDCDDCEYLFACNIKKETDVWPVSPEIEAEIDAESKRLKALAVR